MQRVSRPGSALERQGEAFVEVRAGRQHEPLGQLTDAQTVFLLLLAIRRSERELAALPDTGRTTTMRLESEVAAALEPQAGGGPRAEAVGPTDIDNAMAAVERATSTPGDTGDDGDDALRRNAPALPRTRQGDQADVAGASQPCRGARMTRDEDFRGVSQKSL